MHRIEKSIFINAVPEKAQSYSRIAENWSKWFVNVSDIKIIKGHGEVGTVAEGYTVTTESAAGHVADSILKEAKEGSYDLIVMTKSSVKGISRLIGSVTSKVVRDSEVAVVVIPE